MRFLFGIFFITVFLGISALADEAVMLNSLIEEALQNNPEIKAAESRWLASTKRPSQEGSLPNPTVGTRFKNTGFTKITLGEDPRTDIQAFFIQEIPFPGKLDLKEEVAKEQAEAQSWLFNATTRRVIADLKEAYYDWFLINKSIEITNRNKSILEKFAEIAEVKYEVGKGIQQDVIKAQVELSELIERLELLNKKEKIVKAKIKSILNRPQESDLAQPVEKLELVELAFSLDQISQLAKENAPELSATDKMIDGREKALELAKKQYYPDFVVQGTYFNRDRGSGNLNDIWEIGVGLKVPLYFWRKERFGVEEAVLNLQEARQIYDSTENKLLFKVNDYYLAAQSASRLMNLYKSGIIPQSKLSLESAISGYQVGDVDFLTLLDELVTLFNFELEYYSQLAEYKTAIARLEEITGVDLMK